MKKAKFKILIGGLLLFLFLNIYIVQSEAATASFTSSISTTNVYVGDTITITIKATNAAGMYNVSRTNSNIVVTSGNESEFIENTSTTIKYKATKVGTVSITVSASDMADLDNSSNKVTGSKTYTVTIKEKTNNSSSSGNSGNSNSSSSSGNNTTKTPTFKSANQKIYTTGDCNLRASWTTSSAATSVKKGTELTLTGTSTETIDGYTWYRVTYQGATKYIASSLITYTKPKEDDNKKDDEKSSNKNLSSLTIDGIEMTPTFNKDTTQYAAHVDGDVDELKINAKAEDSKAKVAIEGNKGLKEGDNIIKVKVTAEDETTRTYFITVTKGEGTEIDTKLKLTQLSIERVNFEDTFKPDTYSYELDLTSYVKNLDITAVPSQADATVDISGNEEFKEGQNVIVILLTSADGSETATYQIKVNVPAEVMEQAKEEENTTLYILIGIAVAVVIIAIIVIVRRHRASREDDYEDNFSEDEDKVEEVGRRRFSNYEERYRYQMEENDKEEEEERSSRTSRNSTLDDFLNPQDDDDDDDRKPRGRHSR